MKKLLQSWLTKQAEQRPDLPAVVMNNYVLTYGELETKSNQLAHLLNDKRCQKGDRVCFLIPKSPEAIISIFGILKADCIYVPLDPDSPAARTGKMIKKSGANWILAAGSVESKLTDILAECEIKTRPLTGWVDLRKSANGMSTDPDFTTEEFTGYSKNPPDYKNNTYDPAHILFTSGSTGEPKGVVNTHSNDIHFIEWAVDYFGITSEDRISCHPPLHFDMSGFDIYSAISTGAELHPVSPQLNIYPKFIAEFIRNRRLTQWFSVPSVLSLMAGMDVVNLGDFPELRRLIWCGEVMPTSTLIHLMKRLPQITFTNLYGPTETTIASSYYTVRKCPEKETAEIPIGKAIPGEQLHVLNEDLNPLKTNEVGNLYISGNGVGAGYWEDPSKTNELFLPNPFSDNPDSRIYKTGDLASIRDDGLFYFHGREDDQIKSRGYRIELGEIEKAINSLHLTLECAVVALPADQFGSKIIGCAFVQAPGKEVERKKLRMKLGEILPAYMLPEVWRNLDSLPKNKNGKIDRKLIREKLLNNEIKAIGNR